MEKTVSDLTTSQKSINESKKEEKQSALKTAVLTEATREVVSRLGSANKEFLVGYSGVDNETGKVLKKGLKDISKSTIHKDYADSNIKQQAGFSAEVKDVSRTNAENIINKNPKRKIRTDDLPKDQGGMVNDPLYDHKLVDAKGNVIENSGTQMKFVGNSDKAAVEKIASKDYQKYLDKNVPIEVPSDMYDGMKKEAQEKAIKLREQAQRAKELGKHDVAEQTLEQAKKYEKIEKSLRKSKVSEKEAIEARLNPKISTAKDILKVSHRAGIEQAKMGAAIGGGMSIITNCIACIKNEKDPKEAALSVAKDTASAAAISYGTAVAGSVIKGAMQNAKGGAIRTISKTNLPAIIVTTSLEIGKTMSRFVKGDIDGVECLEELGEKGVGMMASSLYAVIGQVAIPIPVVGALIGSMIGYTLSTTLYKDVLGVLKDAKIAEEERIRIEKECEENIKLIRQYRLEMQEAINEYFVAHITVFDEAFTLMDRELNIYNIDLFMSGANKITRQLEGTPLYETFKDFDDDMNINRETLII